MRVSMRHLAATVVALFVVTWLVSTLGPYSDSGNTVSAGVEDASPVPKVFDADREVIGVLDDAGLGVTGEVFDNVTSTYVNVEEQTCFRVQILDESRLSDGPSRLEGCWDQQVVDDGQAYVRLGMEAGLLFGVVPVGADRIRVDDELIEPSGRIWLFEFDHAPDRIEMFEGDQLVGAVAIPGGLTSP